MKKFRPLFLSVLSSFLLIAAWPVSPFTALIFVAFVPLLLLEQKCKNRSVFLGWTYLSLLIWNIGTTWWTCNSTVPGGIAAIAANSLLMCIPWIGFYNVKKRMGETAGYISLIIFWLAFEYIHLNWELSWPWLTLGNAFATHPGWVQWYEYMGTGGGSFWVMLLNVLIFQLVREPGEKRWTKELRPKILLIAFFVLIPLAISILLTKLRGEQQDQKPPVKNIVIVQPNIDPWDEKHVAGKEEAQIQKLIGLSESLIDSNTALVVWPETAIPVAINEDSLKTSYFMAPVWDFAKKHPLINLLTGVEGFRFYDEQHKTIYSRRIPDSHEWVDAYNSAVLMDSVNFQVYHKSKLVPGAETTPSFLHFLDSWFEKFGGTTGGYARQEERTVLRAYNGSYNIAPSVCYESIYGEFMSKYIHNGASIIAVITNDGWWGNTAGYKQLESYARLRAIETRRWIVRSANTGISCFIDPFGRVFNPQPWDKAAVIKMDIPAKTELTFYVEHGELIFKFAVLATICLVLWNLFLVIKSKIRRG